MDTSPPASRWGGLLKWAVVGVLLASTAGGQAQGFSFESAGARLGIGANRSSSDFQQAEAFADWNLPWHWDLGAKLGLQTRLDLSAGWLGNNHASAAVANLGPLLVLGRERLPISVEGGVSATILSHSDFVSKDFGEPLQFTSHVGLYWDFAPHWRLGYRFQHMSNAGLSNRNPGLNLHLFALSYRF